MVVLQLVAVNLLECNERAQFSGCVESDQRLHHDEERREICGVLAITRNEAEKFPAAIMVFFFNAIARLVVSGVIAVVTLVQLSRRTSGDLFRDDEYPAAQPAG